MTRRLTTLPRGTSAAFRARMLYAISRTVHAAMTSPCIHSQRGAAIVPAAEYHWSEYWTVSASNGPPAPFTCAETPACEAVCGDVCNHAEEAAVLAWLQLPGAPPFDVFHLKVTGITPREYSVSPGPVPSGPPSCVRCSRLMLRAGARGVWLWHTNGWRRYTAEEFHEATLLTLGMPVRRRLEVLCG